MSAGKPRLRMPAVGLAAATLLSGAAALAQPAPLAPRNPAHYGPGRIDASQAEDFIGRNVVACGLASHPNPTLHSLSFGAYASGNGVMGADMLALLPPQADIYAWDDKTICVGGVVRWQTIAIDPHTQRAVPTIAVQDPQQVMVIGGGR
jgi:hypothetical protein